jgi:hypothetical protein
LLSLASLSTLLKGTSYIIECNQILKINDDSSALARGTTCVIILLDDALTSKSSMRWRDDSSQSYFKLHAKRFTSAASALPFRSPRPAAFHSKK